METAFEAQQTNQSRSLCSLDHARATQLRGALFVALACMYSCPHCSAKSIGAWRKVMSTPFSPAICNKCDEASFVSGWSSTIAAAAAEILLWGSIVLAFLMRSFYGLLALPVGIAAVTLLLGQFFPLIPANDSIRVTRRRVIRHTWLVVGVGVTILAAVFLYERYAG
jgi:hypothetical protein